MSAGELPPIDESALIDAVPKTATVNLAIGSSCFVRCEGCYNHFGDTYSEGGLLSAAEIVDFVSDAKNEGVEQATVSGGDPLSHPEIVDILSGVKGEGLTVKLDTVGTALLEDGRIIFKGRGIVPRIGVSAIAPFVDYVNLPLDGASQETVGHFRRGRSNLFAETRAVGQLLRGAGVAFGYNTVANTANIDELNKIKKIAEEDGASEWQVFEFDPNGPNPTNQKPKLKLEPGQFEEATRDLSSDTHLDVVCKSLASRNGLYFLVDDSGQAWKPAGEGLRTIMGHVVRDRSIVLESLRAHIKSLGANI